MPYINLVTPIHQAPAIVRALKIASDKGLAIPIVYNCGGYESVGTLKILEGIVDIYMPDFKYADTYHAAKYSNAPDYPETARLSIKEMHRQVGDLVMDESGVAERGLLIRHLVMPGGIAGSERAFDFIAREISLNSYVNVMDQYRPCYRAREIPELSRPLSRGEYRESVRQAQRSGLSRGLPSFG